MASSDEFVQRIISRCGILPRRVQEDLERELRSHLDDAVENARAQGHEESQILQIVCDRFGHPDEIARELATAHRLEHRAIMVASSSALFGASVIAVAALILAFQSTLAFWAGTSIMKAFPFLREQIAGFMALALGYTGLYLAERMFEKRRFIKALVTNSAVFSLLFTVAFLFWPLISFAPVLAFVCGVSVRALQRTALRVVWVLGPAVPLAISTALKAGESHLWATALIGALIRALIRWIGVTVACYILTQLSKKHEARFQNTAS